LDLGQIEWTPELISSIGTIFFSTLIAWGLVIQGVAIWKHRSGRSVYTPLFIFLTGTRIAALLYGISADSIPLIYNGIVTFFATMPMLIGLWKYKGFSRFEKLISWITITLNLVAWLSPYESQIFLLFSLVLLGFAFKQPWEIYKERSSGVVKLELLIVTFFNSGFWLAYGFLADKWVIKITSPGFFLVFLVTSVLWFRYREPLPQTSP